MTIKVPQTKENGFCCSKCALVGLQGINSAAD